MMSRWLRLYLWWFGWRADRSVSVSESTSRLHAVGVSVHPVAHQILSNFGGLVVPSGIREWLDVLNGQAVRFEITEDVIGECDLIPVYEEHLRMKLTPIGEVTPSGTIVVVSESGFVFGVWGNVLFEYGHTLEDSLATTLIFQKKLPASRAFENGGLQPPWPEPAMES